MTITTHKTASENGLVLPCSFTGKERDAETGYSYFGARYYDSDLSGLFLSVDPMADKYTDISPYVYCAWNPLRLVDPDGRDIWEINQEGKIVNRIKTTERDAFYIVDDNGNRMVDENNKLCIKSISFKYGSVKESSINDRLLNQTGFNITDNSMGADLFKFLADNTSVEYGLITTENKGSFLMTNHKEESVYASSYAKKLSNDGAKVTSVSHNHPRGTEPSGFGRRDTHGDKFSARTLKSSHGVDVSYFVYTRKNEKMYRYDYKEKKGVYDWKTFKRCHAK